jgi:hypothetical protein
MSEQWFNKMFEQEILRATRKSLEKKRVDALLNQLTDATFPVPPVEQTPDKSQKTADQNKDSIP